MALLVSASMYSQRNDNAEYWNTWQYEAKDGMTQKFMEAAAEKTAKFNGTADNAMVTYVIITGRNVGSFLRVQSNKSPADYDNDFTSEITYWQDNVGKYVQSTTHIRWERIKNGSYNYDPENTTPSKFVNRTIYNVKPNKIMHFRRFRMRIVKTLEKRGYSGSMTLFRLTSGGNENTFVAAQPFDTFKRAEEPEQENSFEDDYNSLFGWGSFDEDRDNFNGSLEAWGEIKDTLQLVPEMSTGAEN